MTREEATERLMGKLNRWRDRVGEHLTTAKLLRERGTALALQLADENTRAAVSLERDVLALSLILSSEGDS